MVNYEKEVCEYLTIPNIPLKEWDGKSPFDKGVALIVTRTGIEEYAVASFDKNISNEPRIKKVFGNEPFAEIKKYFVVPTYMDINVDNADLDEESKRKAELLAQEAIELESSGVEEKDDITNTSEWVFDEIKNKGQAIAWLKSYNRTNKIKGRVPSDEETIKMRLLSIRSELNKRKK